MKIQGYRVRYQQRNKYNRIMSAICHEALDLDINDNKTNNIINGELNHSYDNHRSSRYDAIYGHSVAKRRNWRFNNNLDCIFKYCRNYHISIYMYYVVPSNSNAHFSKDKNGADVIKTKMNHNPFKDNTNAYCNLRKFFNRFSKRHNCYTQIINQHTENVLKAALSEDNVHDNLIIFSTRRLNNLWLNTIIHNIYHKVSGLANNTNTSELGYGGKRSTNKIYDKNSPKSKAEQFKAIVQGANKKMNKEQEKKTKKEAKKTGEYGNSSSSQMPSCKHTKKGKKQVKDLKKAKKTGKLGHELHGIDNSSHSKGVHLSHSINAKNIISHLRKLMFNNISPHTRRKVHKMTGTTGVLAQSKVDKKAGHKTQNISYSNFKPNPVKLDPVKLVPHKPKTNINVINKYVKDINPKYISKPTVKFDFRIIRDMGIHAIFEGIREETNMYKETNDPSRLSSIDSYKYSLVLYLKRSNVYSATQSVKHRQHLDNQTMPDSNLGKLDSQTMNINLEADDLDKSTMNYNLEATNHNLNSANVQTQYYIWEDNLDNQTMKNNLVADDLDYQTHQMIWEADKVVLRSYQLISKSSPVLLLQLWRFKPNR